MPKRTTRVFSNINGNAIVYSSKFVIIYVRCLSNINLVTFSSLFCFLEHPQSSVCRKPLSIFVENSDTTNGVYIILFESIVQHFTNQSVWIKSVTPSGTPNRVLTKANFWWSEIHCLACCTFFKWPANIHLNFISLSLSIYILWDFQFRCLKIAFHFLKWDKCKEDQYIYICTNI